MTVIGKSLAYAGVGLALIAVILAEDYLSKVRIHGADFRMVVLALALGLFHLPLAGDFATLFIAFELISIPSYVLAGFNQGDARANEAGMKYLVLGMFASSLFLLGIAFLYGATGDIHLVTIHRRVGYMVAMGATPDLVMVKVAMVFIVGALLFKTATAPLHLWLPDIYEGSNLASLAFLSVPVKVASFGLLGLLLWGPFAYLYRTWIPLILVAALCCAIFGNVQAILQTRLKRILAYSAVANAGFILLSLMLNSAWVFMFYLVVYGLTTLGILAAFVALGTRTTDVDTLEDLRGMGKKYPWLSAALTLMLFSLAGIPVTAGFAAKFNVISAAFRPGAILPPGFLLVLVVSVVLGLVSFFFYFKLVRALWFAAPVKSNPFNPEEEEPSEAPVLDRSLGWNALFVLSLCVVAIVGLGLLMRLPGIPLR